MRGINARNVHLSPTPGRESPGFTSCKTPGPGIGFCASDRFFNPLCVMQKGSVPDDESVHPRELYRVIKTQRRQIRHPDAGLHWNAPAQFRSWGICSCPAGHVPHSFSRNLA